MQDAASDESARRAAARSRGAKFLSTGPLCWTEFGARQVGIIQSLLVTCCLPFFLSSGSATSPFYSTFTYDRAGRMTRKTSPDGENAVGQASSGTGYSISDYTYAGNRTTVQLSNSRGVCVPSNLCLSVKRYSGVRA
jgi:hypothetical protein